VPRLTGKNKKQPLTPRLPKMRDLMLDCYRKVINVHTALGEEIAELPRQDVMVGHPTDRRC
jgi:hypothetical protein